MKTTTADKLMELVKRNYREIAVDFDITRKKEIWPEMKFFAERVCEGSRVLDVGCGNGRLLEAFVDKPIEYRGTDNSAEMLAQAQLAYPDRKFFIADILDLGVVPETGFDWVFCLAVLHHVPTKERRIKAVEEMLAKLKPGGYLVISVWNLWSQAKDRRRLLKNIWRRIMGRHTAGWRELIFPWKNSAGQIVSQRYYHVFTGRELKKTMAAAGSVVVESFRNRSYWCVVRR